ncbi:YeiH family protein [Microlunatus flavus]|uniref:Conserved hypothetical integral membrane protein n=1 Tax=Microlunatus flavus TaxID=1036181 RepID=A0A1H9G3A2_9ACTN|nr:putative sulfate exporter family transporter [Microlunatus flavus]SEQ44550.1 conserved hypothetical integral membrane protein [Microlunatus flavus]
MTTHLLPDGPATAPGGSAHRAWRSRCRPDCDLAPLDPRHLRRRPGTPAWPGLAVVAGATALALLVAHLVPAVNASTVAVVLGVLVTNLGLHRPVLYHGTHLASHRLLRLAVVLLGLDLALPTLVGLGWSGLLVVLTTVAVTFSGTLLLGRLLRVPATRALLVATGFSICGASAVAAMRETVDADEDDTAVAVALVTLCGSLAILLLPPLRGPLGLDPSGFGAWVGASVHDVGQTVATASRVPGALPDAVLVKLTRVVLLAPLVAGTAVVLRRRGARRGGATPGAPSGVRPPLVPAFVVAFLLAVALRSTGVLPASVLQAASQVQQVLLVAALFGLGTTIRFATLRRTGGRALLLGLVSWVLVLGTAYAGVRLTR